MVCKKESSSKMSESEEDKGASGQTNDSKSEYIPYVGGVAAVRRSINALKWRHKQLNKSLSERISAVQWNSRRYKEIMEDMKIHRNRYRKLDERYLQLYELIEGDKTGIKIIRMNGRN